jgi:hypothetical protein
MRKEASCLQLYAQGTDCARKLVEYVENVGWDDCEGILISTVHMPLINGFIISSVV